LNKLIGFATLVVLLAVFQIGTNYSSGQTNNSTLSQISKPSDGNMTYIVIFGNKTIGTIDNQTSFVSSVVGRNLDKIQEEFTKTLSTTPSQELKKEVSKVIDAGVSGASCKNIANPDNRKVDCVKSRDKIFWYVLEIITPKNETSIQAKGLQASLANGTLGYKSLFERITSPKSFTPDEQAAIDRRCESLNNNYLSLSVKDKNWFLANCG
jgi:hypothetical protein